MTLRSVVWLVCLAGCADQPDAVRVASEAAARSAPEGDRAVWVRVSPNHLRSLPLRPEELHPRQNIELTQIRAQDFTVCTQGRCEISVDVNEVSMSVLQGGSIGVGIGARVASGSVGVRYEQSWPCMFTGRPECAVSIDTARQAPTNITARAELVPWADPTTGVLGFRLGNVTVPTGVDGGDLTVTGGNVCGQVWCNVAQVAGVTSSLLAQATSDLGGVVQQGVGERVCRTCPTGVCPSGSQCVDGVCRDAGGCLPVPLAAETTIMSEDSAAGARVGLALIGPSEARRGGLEIPVRLTAEPTASHRCVAALEAPQPEPLAPNVLTMHPDRAPIRVAIGRAGIRRALWALFAGGVACRTVRASDLESIPRGMMLGLLPSLAHLDNALPSLSLRPSAVPTVEVRSDGALGVRVSIEVELAAPWLGRQMRLAVGTLTAEGQLSIGSEDDAIVLQLPHETWEIDVAEVWVSPLLANSEASVEGSFTALATLALGLLPPSLPLDELLPDTPYLDRVRLGGQPIGVETPRGGVLLIDLDFTGPE